MLQTSRPPARPPHPSARQRARNADGLPDVVLCTGPAEHYEGNIHVALKLVLVPDAPFEIRRRGARHRAGPGQLVALHTYEAHSGGPRPTARAQPAATAGQGDPTWILMCLGPATLADAGVPAHLALPRPVLDQPHVASDYRRLHRLVDGHAPTLTKQAALARFVAALARHAAVPLDADPRDDVRHPRLAAARDYLGDQLDRNVSLAELAAITGMSRYQVLRAFTRHFGLPPHTMHLRLRLDRAQDLLRRGQRATDVAHATGFTDQAHFTRSFKRLYGTTPARYQRNALRS